MPGNDHQVSFERHGNEWRADGKRAKEHKLAFGKATGPHKIAFHVGTPTGRFQFSEDDPIWVKIDDGECPDSTCSHPDIEVLDCKPTRLVVENRNDSEAVLRYQLNVYDRVNSQWCPVDPIIDNGGHG